MGLAGIPTVALRNGDVLIRLQFVEALYSLFNMSGVKSINRSGSDLKRSDKYHVLEILFTRLIITNIFVLC